MIKDLTLRTVENGQPAQGHVVILYHYKLLLGAEKNTDAGVALIPGNREAARLTV